MQIWYGENWRENSLISQTNWIHDMTEKKIYIYIIHSWTKIFSCTGIRYGSLICPNQEIYNKLLNLKNPWSVNILALIYIDKCIKDYDYLIKTWHNTKVFRKYQIDKLIELFPNWKFKGEDFLSWIWIETGSYNEAKMAYDLCKLNGTPIRLGKIGYNMDNYIRISVREKIHFDNLFNCLRPLSNLLSENKFNKLKNFNIDNDIIYDFKYIDTELLLSHENYIEERHNKLFDYINSSQNDITIPAIIICKDNYTIIDGHHRVSIIKKLKIKKCPCILVNYKNSNIIVNINKSNITKDMVIESSKTGCLLNPKSTCHYIIDNDSNKIPIICISPIVKLFNVL